MLELPVVKQRNAKEKTLEREPRGRRDGREERKRGSAERAAGKIPVRVRGHRGASQRGEIDAVEPSGWAEGGHCHFEATDDAQPNSGDRDAARGPNCFY